MVENKIKIFILCVALAPWAILVPHFLLRGTEAGRIIWKILRLAGLLLLEAFVVLYGVGSYHSDLTGHGGYIYDASGGINKIKGIAIILLGTWSIAEKYSKVYREKKPECRGA